MTKRNGFFLTFAVVGVLALAGCSGNGQQRRSSGTPGTTRASGNVAVEPVVTSAHVQRLEQAEAARASGDYEVALTAFREILAENPTVTSAYVGMGEIYIETQDYERAETVFSRAVRLEPLSFAAQFGHGLALQMLGKFIDAVRAYHRALVLDPNHPKANLNMATTYLQIGEPINALPFAEKAIEHDPTNGPARVNLGAVYERVGRHADAIEQYKAAMELMEPTAPLLSNLVNALAHEQRYQEAINAAEFAIRLSPSANIYERKAWAHFRLKQYEESLAAYEEAVKLDPGHWPSLNGVGVNALNTWILSGKTDGEASRKARNAFRRSLKANTDQPKIIRLLTTYSL